jgi:hypothetical protein
VAVDIPHLGRKGELLRCPGMDLGPVGLADLKIFGRPPVETNPQTMRAHLDHAPDNMGSVVKPEPDQPGRRGG